MRRSVITSREPTLRESRRILEEAEMQIRELGAAVTTNAQNAVRFRLGSVWRQRRLGLLAAISSGTVDVTATGGPRRLTYTLKFDHLRNACLLLTLTVTALAWQGRRDVLLGMWAVIWVLGFGLCAVMAASRFRAMMRAVVERVVGGASVGRSVRDKANE